MTESVGPFLSHICNRIQNINISLIILQQNTCNIKIKHFKAASEKKQSDDLKTDGTNLKKIGKKYFDVRRVVLLMKERQNYCALLILLSKAVKCQ